MKRVFSTAVALAVVATTGVVYGTWTGRWAQSPKLGTTLARLATVPKSFGDWDGEDAPIDDKGLENAGISGYVSRRYVNRRTREAVTILLLCGRPGPISVHRPETCYGGAGYELVGERVKTPVDESTAQASDSVWAIDLEKPGTVDSDRLRILYGWSADGRWTASARPRIEFAGEPALFKLYVIHGRPDVTQQHQTNSGLVFLREFVPALRRSLWGRG